MRMKQTLEYNGYRIIARAHPRATNRLEITSAHACESRGPGDPGLIRMVSDVNKI